jgi:hypothetical protein
MPTRDHYLDVCLEEFDATFVLQDYRQALVYHSQLSDEFANGHNVYLFKRCATCNASLLANAASMAVVGVQATGGTLLVSWPA